MNALLFVLLYIYSIHAECVCVCVWEREREREREAMFWHGWSGTSGWQFSARFWKLISSRQQPVFNMLPDVFWLTASSHFWHVDPAVLLNTLQPVFNTLTREVVFTANDQFLSHWSGTFAGQLPASFQCADQGVLVDGFQAATDETQLGWMTGGSRRCRTCSLRGVFWRATPVTRLFFLIKTSLKRSQLRSSLH